MIRESQNLSQGDITRLSGVKQYTISVLELGKVTNPGFIPLVKIGLALGLDPNSVAALMHLVPPPMEEDERLVPEARRILTTFATFLANLEEQEQRHVAAVLRGVYQAELNTYYPPTIDEGMQLPEFIRRKISNRS